MIRSAQEQDAGRIADIWLDTNIKAHAFIAAQYWRANFEVVKKMLPQAELYVYEDERGIQGFVGLRKDYVAGIFVRSEAQSQGIGKKLIGFVKGRRERLSLKVYQKNRWAVKFYLSERFSICGEGIDEGTGEAEYTMEWKMAQETCKLKKTVV